MLSIIIPTLNEASTIGAQMEHLVSHLGQDVEVIIVDGNSDDNTLAIAQQYPVHVISVPKGRANQLQAGAHYAKGDTLLFLHADTLLPNDFKEQLTIFQYSSHLWGRFDVQLSSRQLAFRMIEAMMNWRSRISGIATGDQAIFVKKTLFHNMGGFKNVPIMEDIILSKTLRGIGRPLCINSKVITSSRRWEQNGIAKTVGLMWLMRFLFFVGVSPNRLARLYQ